MRIESIAAYGNYTKKSANNGNKPVKQKKSDSGDSYIPSKASGGSKLHLESVKAKINSGYYSSEKVVDDIVDKLGSVFDQL